MKTTPERMMRLVVTGIFTCVIAAGVFYKVNWEVLLSLIVAVCSLLGKESPWKALLGKNRRRRELSESSPTFSPKPKPKNH